MLPLKQKKLEQNENITFFLLAGNIYGALGFKINYNENESQTMRKTTKNLRDITFEYYTYLLALYVELTECIAFAFNFSFLLVRRKVNKSFIINIINYFREQQSKPPK